MGGGRGREQKVKSRGKRWEGGRDEEKKMGDRQSGFVYSDTTSFFWKRDGLHTNEELQFFGFFSTGEDMKSSVLFSPTAIILWMSEAEMERLWNLNNDLNEVISMEGVRACLTV